MGTAVRIRLYLGIGAFLYYAQRSLMYFPETVRTPPAQAGLPEAEEVTLTAADGVDTIAWTSRHTMGNRSFSISTAMAARCDIASTASASLSPTKFRLIALEYRGYGGSSGSPSEAGLIADSEAAYAFAIARYPAQQLVLWGEFGRAPPLPSRSRRSGRSGA